MRRRPVMAALTAALGGILIAPRPARAQADRAPLRIGLLPDFGAGGSSLKVLADALEESGRVEGRDYRFIRSGVHYGADSQLALARVMQARPDLIIVMNLGYAVAARRVDPTVPVVMWISGFPVEGGVAQSLARPGGNVTGMTIYASGEFFGKLLQLVHEARPGSRRIGVLMSYVPPFHPRAETDLILKGMRDVAAPLGVELLIHEIARPEQVDDALAALVRQRVEALVLTADTQIAPRLKDVFRFAAERRLPAIIDSPWSELGDPQPLLEYRADFNLLLRQAAAYVEKILWQGARPAELPIQLPSRFVLTVNQRTAKAIGLTLPQALLLRADRVVE